MSLSWPIAWARSATEILGWLDAARQPHQIGRHGGGQSSPRTGALNRLPDLDQRLDAAKRLGPKEKIRVDEHAPRTASGCRNETMPENPGERMS